MSEVIFDDIADALIDGINVEFTTIYDFIDDSVRVYLNGQLLDPDDVDDGYVETSPNIVTLNTAPEIGDNLQIYYRTYTTTGLYISIDDIRAEGVTEIELSDERATALIVGWQSWFEKMTGNFFIPQTLTLDFDGDGSRMLQLPVPIISVDEFYINDDFDNALDPSEYVVYNRRGPVQDDRNNPRIKLKRMTSTAATYVFSTTSSTLATKMAVGDQNIRVVGTWGYTELDGSVPPTVAKAILVLVMATSELLSDDDIDQLRFGRIIEEVTDRHRIEYSDLYNRLQTWAPTGITIVDQALAMYRAPVRVDAPRNVGLLY